MKCKYCYATFNDFKVASQLTLDESFNIIEKLYNAGVKKITFAGGEPMLWKNLDESIIFAKSIGMTTSIITNGALIKEQWLIDMQDELDWIGISVDSINHSTNDLIGRKHKGFSLDYYTLIDLIHKYNYKLKINTVVNSLNHKEDLNKFINYANPKRWKVFQALRVEGQNDEHWKNICITKEEFNSFLNRHNNQLSLVPENNEAMTGSYLLVDPLGRLFENSKGTHTYSDPLQYNSIDHCLKQISLNRDMFIKRGGLYNW